MNVIPYTEEKRKEWKQFLLASNNGTLFHDLDFLEYHPTDKFQFHHLLFYQDDRLVALLPAHILETESKKQLISPVGASIGGPVIPMDFRASEALEMTETLIKYAKESNISEISIRSAPVQYMKSPTDLIGFSLQAYGFRLEQRWMSMMIPLSELNSVDVLLSFSKGKRRDVRAGLRDNLKPREGKLEELNIFYKILMETQNRLKSKPTHNLNELKRISHLVPNNMRLFFCDYDNNPLASILVFILNPITAMTFYICQSDEYIEKLSVAVLFAYIIETLVKSGFRFLDLGTVTFDDYSLNEGLAFFKEGFCARAFSRDLWIWRDRSKKDSIK